MADLPNILRAKNRCTVTLLAVTLSAAPLAWAAEQKIPAEVKSIVDRMEGCEHWAGEEGDTLPARTAQIEHGTKILRCDQLEADARRIRLKYAQNKAVQQVLKDADESWSASFGESLFANQQLKAFESEEGYPLKKTMAKRAAPLEVPPVAIDGVQYIAHYEISVKSGGEATIEARDSSSGKSLWQVPVYRITYELLKETDVQDVYISSITVNHGKIVIKNERDDVYTLDPMTRAVTTMPASAKEPH